MSIDAPVRRRVLPLLIVEDEAVIRASLAEYLADEGFDVATSSNCRDAIAQVRQRDFVVAI